MRTVLGVAAALFAAAASPVLAQQGIDQLVVTASRTPRLLTDTPASVEVVGAPQLERTFGLTFIDQLKKNASLDIIQYPNGLAGVGLRGFRPDFEFTINPRTLVLVDGRPSGSSSFTTISPESIDHIEVLKGPASALYGASAMGGVVNILTRRSTGPFAGSASVGYGSFDTARADLNMGGALGGGFDFDLGAGYVDQDENFRTGSGAVRPNSDFSRRSGKLRLGRPLGSDWRLDMTVDAARLSNNAPGPVTFNPQSRNFNETSRLGGDLRLEGSLGAHKLKAVGYVSKEGYDFWETPVGVARYRSTRVETRFRGLQLQDSWRVAGPLVLTYGYDKQKVQADRFGWDALGARRAPSSPNESRRTDGLFGEAELTLAGGRLILTGGGRQDWIKAAVLPTPYRTNLTVGQDTFRVFNPRGGVVLKLTDALRLHGSAGKAFVPPQASQLAAQFEEFAGVQRRLTVGNPDLRPERNKTIDGGIGYSSRLVRGDLTYFVSDTRDRITTRILVDTPTLRTTSYVNADRSRSRGLEGVLTVDGGSLVGWAPDRLTVTTSATRIFEAAEYVAGVRGPIRNVARWKANVSATVSDGGRLSGTISVRYDGARYGTDNSQGKVFTRGLGGNFLFKPATVVDLSGRWKVTPKDSFRLEVANLFDTAYYEVADYPMPGRAVYGRYVRAF